MRYPDFLSQNATVGFAAPSFGCTSQPYKSAFESALGFFETHGKSVQIGENVYKEDGIGISSTPESCGAELTRMYCDENNDCLISVGGGELMCEILPYVDFEKIGQSKPKWFCGYSDNTNFIFLNTIINDVAGIYAPCAGAFGMKPLHRCMKDYYNLLSGKTDEDCTGEPSAHFAPHKTISFDGYDMWEKESLKSAENPLATINATEKSHIKTYIGNRLTSHAAGESEISFTGRLTGGCMDILVTLLGTRFDKVGEFNEKYKDDGIIWFLESCDLNVFAIRRALWQMDNAGWFRYVKGFVIGRPLCMGQEMMGLNQYDAVTGILGKYNVPIVMDADIGHVSPSMPVVCGSIGEVHAAGDSYGITYHFC